MSMHGARWSIDRLNCCVKGHFGEACKSANLNDNIYMKLRFLTRYIEFCSCYTS